MTKQRYKGLWRPKTPPRYGDPILVNSLAATLVLVVLAIVGIAMMSCFRAFAQEVPEGRTVAGYADKLFLHFIATQLPVEVSGLVVSGMFSAAMSSVNSGVNSISAVVLRDLVDRFRMLSSQSRETYALNLREAGYNERRHVRAVQMLAVIVGVVVVCGNTLIEHVPENLMVVAKRVNSLLAMPIFTLFFMALFMRSATAVGANAGALVGFITTIVVSFWDPLFEDRPLSITWINPASLVVGIAVEILGSVTFRKSAAYAK